MRLSRIHSQRKTAWRSRLAFVCVALWLAIPSIGRAQSADSSLFATYIFAGIGGFIPTQEGYRLNYSTSFAGLPIELSGGLLFPASPSVFVPITVRYINREAKFISGTSLSVLSIEPGVRFFLEHERKNDLRLFGAIEALFARATATGTFSATHDGQNPSDAIAQAQYVNYGLGVDLGLTYPLNINSSLDGMAHVATYFGSPTNTGGLGDIGGVSLVILYRVGF